MRITRITERRVRNLGNDETRTVEWEALLAEGDDPTVAQASLRRLVEAALFYAPPAGPEYDLGGLQGLEGDDVDE